MGASALSRPTGDRPEERRDPGTQTPSEARRLRERAEQVRDRTRERKEQVRERTEHVRDRTRERTEQARMTVYRLFGIDRSGPPPPQTLPGEPLRIWTIPNVVGLVRLAFVPVFLVLALASDDGTHVLPAVLFAVIAGTDYLDGFLARLTGQYSRFGALLDPVTDRSLVLAGGIVCWSFDLLPRWALAVLVARELYMLVAGRMALGKGLKLQVNWWGRLAVWPTMGALFAALLGVGAPARVALVVGVAMALVAAAKYTRDARRELRGRRAAALDA
ncbi:CDP-alcohol phosphatidyltransferase family protein [Patulibacter sp. SYSU D01012]|uniref:CDP-alcohol phosphatidyltransferase family protein n=1 Tax=Patulibacter sp. SYSU D01012 TaxID=2817381 RepID=UPI001B3096BC